MDKSNTIKLLYPKHWNDYELIDSGEGEKLERFGKYITIRPEPQAVWERGMPFKEWEKRAHVHFIPKSSSQGDWKKLKEMPDQWKVNYNHNGLNINLRLGLTRFKHVGVFPEQAAHWDYIYQSVKGMKTPNPKFLNLFAYTGGSTLAAKAAGADIIHLDSIKQVVTWAKQNMEISNLEGVRWMVEDAVKFVKRSVKRGTKFEGIIMDPPAFGHGPNGENWKLERDINQLIKDALQILNEEENMLVMNTYSLGFSSLIIENLMKANPFPKNNLELGELLLKSSTDQNLPLGVFARFSTSK